jgi:hypothetical protein
MEEKIYIKMILFNHASGGKNMDLVVSPKYTLGKFIKKNKPNYIYRDYLRTEQKMELKEVV